jgi:acetyltransferase EpsM
MTTPIIIPLLNPNEPEAQMAGLFVQEGQYVQAGDPLCNLETTKSTAEVVAEQDGYVSGLSFIEGQTVQAGKVLCYLADTPGSQPPREERAEALPGVPGARELPPGLRITQPALALADQHSLVLDAFPIGPLVTESMVRAAIEAQPVSRALITAFDPTAIIVYGGGGHGKTVIEMLRTLGGYHILGIVDDGLRIDERVFGMPVLGGAQALPGIYAQGVRLAVNAVGGIGNIASRIQVFQRLAQAGFACPAIVHPTAHLEPSVDLSPGVQVFAHAYVGSEARVGYGCIVNTGAIVSHGCRLGDYANISPGAILAGDVEVGASVLVGMGVTINLGVKIGQGARLGNGATIKKVVPERGVVRAGTIWPD